MAMLVTERGRLATLQCVRSKIPLSGSGSDVGIGDCQAAVEELQRLKAGPKPETTSGGAGFPPRVPQRAPRVEACPPPQRNGCAEKVRAAGSQWAPQCPENRAGHVGRHQCLRGQRLARR